MAEPPPAALLTFTIPLPPSHTLTVVSDPCGTTFPSLGAGLWHAASDLAEFVASVPSGGWWDSCTSVVELGARCGVPGQAAALAGTASVVCTDTAAALPCLTANVAANALSVSVVELDWRTVEQTGEVPPDVPASPSLVLAADVAYDDSAWPALAATLTALLLPNTNQAWLALPSRAESVAFHTAALAPAGLAWRPLRRCPPREEGAHAVTLWQVWKPVEGPGRALFVLDFDWTVIEANSDTVALAALDAASSSTAATDAMKAAYTAGRGWTAAMDAGLKAGAKAVGDAETARCVVTNAVVWIHLAPRIANAVTAAKRTGHRVAIVSDANDVFIRDRLAAADVAVSTAVTNPAAWRADGSLAVSPAVPVDGPPHGCPACPPNLCKGREAERELIAFPPPARLVVAGDGANDACAAARAGPRDAVLVRTVYPDGRQTPLARGREDWGHGGPRIVEWATADALGAALEREVEQR